jgi:flagellar hook protein FlgE
MISATSSALSGLQSASARLNDAARNIASAGDVGPLTTRPEERPAEKPADSVPSAEPSGGTTTSYRPASATSRPGYGSEVASDDADGSAERSEPDVSSELINAIDAREAYKANLKTLEVATQVQRSFLEVVA